MSTEFSSLKVVEKLAVEDRGLVCRVLWLKMQGCLSPNSKDSRFPRKECTLGGREGSLPSFTLLKCGCILNQGLGFPD